jgi:N-acetylmuramoyl-L-alanine amidase
MDGGAQSQSGIMEKDINLAIGVYLQKELESAGFKVIMTRTDDTGLYSEDSQGSIRSLKSEDIRKRKSIIDNSNCLAAVSIHLNSYREDETVRGGQVFYSGECNDEIKDSSLSLATSIQSEFNKTINESDPRTQLEKSDIYILQNVTVTTVLVECGFLSNPEEACNLSEKAYQKKIARVIGDCIIEQYRNELSEIP